MSTSIKDIVPLVGNTPLLAIDYTFNNVLGTVYAKYEQKNMTGSIKDRMALHILSSAYMDGSLCPGDTIVEVSSGNTGISFAAIGKALGHTIRIYMPDWMSQERIKLISSFGAEVVLVSSDQGGFLGSIKLARAYAQEHNNTFLPNQFDNISNIEAHALTTGPEIELQLRMLNKRVNAFVAGVGTGGTLMGTGRYLRRNGSVDVMIHPLEPANSPTLKTGYKTGTHRIQGISDEFIPNIVDLNEMDDIVDIWDGDAILMSQLLCKNLGLAVGISSGANFLGAMKIASSMGPNYNAVTVFPDSNKKYLSTDLCCDEKIKDNYLTPNIKLLGFKSVC